MASGQQRFHRTWEAVPDSVGDARHAVKAHLAAARTSNPPLDNVCLAVSEAVTNVVRHAYGDRDSGPVHVQIEIRPDEVMLTIEDEGAGLAPRSDSPRLGLGLPIITTVADRFEWQPRDGGGTRLCMWFDSSAGERSAL